jgi:hypothetical protein
MKNFYQDLVKTIRIRSDSLPKHWKFGICYYWIPESQIPN